MNQEDNPSNRKSIKDESYIGFRRKWLNIWMIMKLAHLNEDEIWNIYFHSNIEHTHSIEKQRNEHMHLGINWETITH